MVRYAKLSLPFNAKLTQSELLTLKEEWQPHFNVFYYEGLWTGFPLRTADGKLDTIIPDLMGHGEYQDTSYMPYFPSVIKMLSGVNCPIMSVRFLNLKAGAVIKQHRDNELAFEKGEARLHFPVITNPNVEFYIENERIIMHEGESWYINANLPHKVSNNGDTDRVHLVVDCKVNEWLKDIIHSSDEISFKNEPQNQELLMIIKELRLQNTEVSNKLAFDMEQQLKGVNE